MIKDCGVNSTNAGALRIQHECPLQTPGFLTLYNQSSLEESRNEPTSPIKVPRATEKEEKKKDQETWRK